MRPIVLVIAVLTASPALADQPRLTPTLEVSYMPDDKGSWGLGLALDYRNVLQTRTVGAWTYGVSGRVDVFFDGRVQASVEPLGGVVPVLPPDRCGWSAPFLNVEARTGLVVRSGWDTGLVLGGSVTGSPGASIAGSGRLVSVLPLRAGSARRADDQSRFTPAMMSVGLGPTVLATECLLTQGHRRPGPGQAPDGQR